MTEERIEYIIEKVTAHLSTYSQNLIDSIRVNVTNELKAIIAGIDKRVLSKQELESLVINLVSRHEKEILNANNAILAQAVRTISEDLLDDKGLSESKLGENIISLIKSKLFNYVAANIAAIVAACMAIFTLWYDGQGLKKEVIEVKEMCAKRSEQIEKNKKISEQLESIIVPDIKELKLKTSSINEIWTVIERLENRKKR